MPTIVLDLPFPKKTGNHQWIRRPGGYGLHKSVTSYRKEVGLIVRETIRPMGPVAAECSLSLTLRPPDRRRRDLDNVIKIVMDALEHGGLYENDSQIKTLYAERKEPAEPGSIRASLQWEAE